MKCYGREGIILNLESALIKLDYFILPEVINANAFVRPIKGSKQRRLELAVNNVNHYLKHYTNVKELFQLKIMNKKKSFVLKHKAIFLRLKRFMN